MKILIVEDQDDKLEALIEYISRAIRGATIEAARSYFDAKAALRAKTYDCVVLDMSIPIYRAECGSPGTVLVYGGEELLGWAKFRAPNIKVAVLTQYDFFTADGNDRSLTDIRRDFQRDFGNIVLRVIHYQETDNKWQSDLLDVFVVLGAIQSEHIDC